jgi:hypothetical protein
MSLLAQYSPWLQYDSQESFFTDSVATMTDRAGNVLATRKRHVIAAAHPANGEPELSVDFLAAKTYINGRAVDPGDYLDAVGKDYVKQARAMHAKADYADRVFGHELTTDDGTTWLQYWFFSYYNNKSFLGFGLHEGDWEMIQIRVGAGGEPDAVTFAQHKDAERRTWHDLELRGGAPVIYVALGSHASHPHKGKYPAPVVPDYNDAKGPLVRPALEVIDDDYPSWAAWPGFWGSTKAETPADSPSPRGPCKHGQWTDPATFHAHAKPGHEVRKDAERSRQEPEPPAPQLSVYRDGDQAVVDYTFPPLQPGQPPPAAIVVSLDCPTDDLPPATFTFPVTGQAGVEAHPFAVGDGAYEIRASAASEDGRMSPTSTITLPAA